MQIEITEGPVAQLDEYAKISIAFEVRQILELTVRDAGLGGIHLRERPVETPYTKDYDALESPARWPERFDVSRWRALVARVGGERVGGLVLAFDTPGVHMLEGRRDLAVIWDLRVAAAMRRRGVGARLFGAAEAWATARGVRTLKVETQNVNVGACRFYARRGCTLGEINRFAYPQLPGEVQLVWRKALAL